MSKHIKKIKILSEGNPCPKCEKLMERRGHTNRPNKLWFYEKWDYCPRCKHIQHYEEFKTAQWKEIEERETLFKYL